MTALTRWHPTRELSERDPFRELDDFSNRLSRFFGSPSLRRGDGREDITVAKWVPLVDIAEDDKEYLIKVELPEVEKDDFKVAVASGTLTISGERKAEKAEKSRKFHRVERYFGRFERRLSIPHEAEGDN